MSLPAQPFFATPAQRLAWARQRFFERGEAPTGLVSEALIQSWQRCVRAGREGSERVAFEPVSAVRLDSALRRSRQLCEAAAESFQRLELALGGTGCRLLLADADGMIVRLSQVPTHGPSAAVLPHQTVGEFHLVQEGLVRSMKAQRSLIDAEQVPFDRIEQLARETKGQDERQLKLFDMK